MQRVPHELWSAHFIMTCILAIFFAKRECNDKIVQQTNTHTHTHQTENVGNQCQSKVGMKTFSLANND